MEPPSKRPRKTRTRLTFAQKVEVLRRLHNGEKQVELAKELGCSKRALSRLKQDRHYFEQLELKPSDSNRKSRRAVRHISLENKLVDFFSLAKRNGFPLSSNAICNGAIRLREVFLDSPAVPEPEKRTLRSFQASLSWSKAFMKRANLRASDDKYFALPRENQLNTIRELKEYLSDYDLDCIVSVDTTNFFYELLPSEVNSPEHHTSDTSSPKRKSPKRLTLLVAANTTGTLKVPMTIVYSEKAPRCFRERSSPVPYLWHQCGWVGQSHFRAWFYSIFLPAVRKFTSKRMALIVDKEWHSADIADNRGQVTIIAVSSFLTNATYKTLCGSIMSVLRRTYRYAIAELMVQNAWPAQTPRSVFARRSEMEGLLRGERPTLYEATELIRAAWEAIPVHYIARCWLEISILPEQHAAQLFNLHGRHERSTPEQMFFSCCTESRRESLKIVQSLIRDCDAAGQKVKESVAQKVCGVGQKMLDRWLDAEDSQIAQSWLEAELEDLVTRFGPASSLSGEDAPTEVSDFCTVRNVNLPNAGCIMELLAPIQSIVDECESGRANSILYELKQELARVRASQEQQGEQVVRTTSAPSTLGTTDREESARPPAPVQLNCPREEANARPDGNADSGDIPGALS
ncbi:DDE superfamily endonuclease [Gracilaria domingensis]|nr:DDE superfamily endonuclease [Gracilaria domingensis]